MNAQKEIQACPVCSLNLPDAARRAVAYPLDNLKKTGIEPESIIFCDSCGAGIAVPVCSDEELEKYYSEGNYWSKQKIELLTARKYPVPYALALSRWKLLEPLISDPVKKVSILDIGAGHGFYGMEAAKSKKVQLGNYTCVEKDKALVESLKKTWSKYFNSSTLETTDHIEKVEGKFDVAVLSHVLEHRTDPQSFLRSVLVKLRKGAFIFIDVPNQDYLFKKDVFPHLIFFNPSSLRGLMENSGLAVRFVTPCGNEMSRYFLNSKNVSWFSGLPAKIVMKLTPFLPEYLIVRFFTVYFEMNSQNDNGVWLRAIGQFNG